MAERNLEIIGLGLLAMMFLFPMVFVSPLFGIGIPIFLLPLVVSYLIRWSSRRKGGAENAQKKDGADLDESS